MTKKNIIYLAIAAIIVLASAAAYFFSRPTATDPTTAAYKYENKDLGFELSLPAEFQYFQTQRKTGQGFVDIEIFVPTSDTLYSQEVPGYGKPVVVRVYEEDAYKEEVGFDKVKAEGSRVYAIKFWDKVPDDWKEKWTEPVKQQVINSLID